MCQQKTKHQSSSLSAQLTLQDTLLTMRIAPQFGITTDKGSTYSPPINATFLPKTRKKLRRHILQDWRQRSIAGRITAHWLHTMREMWCKCHSTLRCSATSPPSQVEYQRRVQLLRAQGEGLRCCIAQEPPLSPSDNFVSSTLAASVKGNSA